MLQLTKSRCLALFAGSVALGAAVACSSSDDSTPVVSGGDGGIDAASADASRTSDASSVDASPSSDAAKSDGSMESDAGSDASADSAADAGDVDADVDAGPDYCTIQNDYLSRCGQGTDAGSTACEQALLAQCRQNSKLASDIYHQAIAQCFSATSSCDNLSDGTCSSQVLSSNQPTAAQLALRTHVCTVCANGDSTVQADCESGLYYDADAGTIGLGFSALMSNDTLVSQIDTTCVTNVTHNSNLDSQQCILAFGTCANSVHDAANDNSQPPACAIADAGSD